VICPLTNFPTPRAAISPRFLLGSLASSPRAARKTRRVEIALRAEARYFARRFGAKVRKLRRMVEGFAMGDARCNCGAITLSLPEEPSKIVVACHCIDCQRRTGAPFGVGAYYPAEVVTISGTSKEFTHAAASGGKMHNYFCPQCGSTVYWKVSNLPAMIGVAVGAMADPKYPAPVISVFEQSKHDWVQIGGAVAHFQQSYLPKNSN
jgi:hypothetical protein